MQILTPVGGRSFHPYEPFDEVESRFNTNLYYHGICAWQYASEDIQRQYLGYGLMREEFQRLSESMEHGEHCKEKFRDASMRAMLNVSGRIASFGQAALAMSKPDLCLCLASFTQSKIFGAEANEGDLVMYFLSHPEHDEEAWFELMLRWRQGNSGSLLSFLYERMQEAVEAYEAALNKYGCALARVVFLKDLEEFVPLSDVLDTEYFLLHALIEFVEPKVGRC